MASLCTASPRGVVCSLSMSAGLFSSSTHMARRGSPFPLTGWSRTESDSCRWIARIDLASPPIVNVGWDSHGDVIVTMPDTILRMLPDGSRQTTLLKDPRGEIRSSSVCGRSGVTLLSTYDQLKTTTNIWRLDGKGPVQNSSRTARMRTGRSARRMEVRFTTGQKLGSSSDTTCVRDISKALLASAIH